MYKENCEIPTEAFAICDNRVYASAMNKNGLYCMEWASGEAHCIALFPDETPYMVRLHCAAALTEDKVVFFPDQARHIHIYEIAKNRFQTVPIHVEKEARFVYGFVYGTKMFCVQSRPYNAIRIFTENGQELNTIRLPKSGEYAVLQRDMVIEDDTAYLINKGDKQIVKVNLDAETVEILTVDGFETIKGGFGTICKTGDTFYLSSQGGIIEWDNRSRCGHLYDVFPEGFGTTYINREGTAVYAVGFVDRTLTLEQPFSASIILQKRMFLFPFQVNMCIVFDLETKMMMPYEEIEECEDEASLKRKGRVTTNRFLYSRAGKIAFFSTLSNRIYYFSKSAALRSVQLHGLPLERELLTQDGIIYEDEYSLNDFLAFVIKGNVISRETDHRNIGEGIFVSSVREE